MGLNELLAGLAVAHQHAAVAGAEASGAVAA